MTTYYVRDDGSDEATGLSDAQAWRTLQWAAQWLRDGDTLLLKRGSTFSAEFHVTGVADLTIDAYGDAPDSPVIYGGAVATGWVQHSGPIYRLPEAWSDPYIVLAEGEPIWRQGYLSGGQYQWDPIILDQLQDNQWAWDESGTLYFRSDAGNPDSVGRLIEVADWSRGMRFTHCGNLQVKNIHVRVVRDQCIRLEGQTTNALIEDVYIEAYGGDEPEGAPGNNQGGIKASGRGCDGLTVRRVTARWGQTDTIQIIDAGRATIEYCDLGVTMGGRLAFEGRDTWVPEDGQRGGADGIHISGFGTDYITIRHNRIDQTGTNSKQPIIMSGGRFSYIGHNTLIGGPSAVQFTNPHSLLEHNICLNNNEVVPYAGAFYMPANYDPGVRDITYFRNVIVNASRGWAFHNHNFPDLRIIQNTIINSGRTVETLANARISGEFKNNVIVGSDRTMYVNVISGETWDSDYNVLHRAGGGTLVTFNGTSYSSLSAWQENSDAQSVSKDANSLSFAAEFVNADGTPEGDYHLAPGSPAIDAGDVIPEYTEHYRGTAPDMGALETGVPFGFPSEWEELATVTGTSFTDAALPGGMYEYRVTPINDFGEGVPGRVSDESGDVPSGPAMYVGNKRVIGLFLGDKPVQVGG